MKPLFPWSLIVLMTAIPACAPAWQPTGATAQPPAVPAASATSPAPSPLPAVMPPSGRLAPSTIEPTLAPHPLNVRVKLEDTLAASAVISSTGGTLSVKAADGTKFTLGIPKDALSQEEKVTLTPILSVEGLPFSGGLVGSVQMAPEGLRLFQPASLTIETPRATPPSGYGLVAFAYHQTGEEFYLTPAQTEGNKIMIPVWHFSGGGAAQGTASEIQSQFQRVPSNPEDAMNQRIAEYLIGEREHQLRGEPSDPDISAKINAYQREYFLKFIQPKLALIRQDCEASKRLLPQALGWLRMVQLWGSEDKFQSESEQIYDAWDDGIVNCYNKEYDQCLVDKDIKHRSAMLSLLRLAEMGRSSKVVARLDKSKPWRCPRRSYRVDATVGEAHLIGTICSLDKPFKLEEELLLCKGTNTFTPSSSAAGTVQGEGTCSGIGVYTLSGSYTISGADTAPVLQWNNLGGTLTTPYGSGGQDTWSMDLPLQSIDPPCDE